MATEIPWETRCTAEDAYICEGMTYEQVSALTGVSVSQLKRWGAQGQWPQRRREYRAALAAIKQDTVRLRRKLLENALASLDPQAVYAAARMEQVAAAAAKKDQDTPGRQAAISPDISISTPQQAVDALQAAMEARIARMAGGNIDLAGVKQVQQCLELIEKLKAKYAPEKAAKKQLTQQQLQEIKEQLKL